ncbi:MAG: nitroreductase [Lachnospiraceae bacterium]|nr:nitroreductase [Lachnospiraceae bacterium]
MKNALEVMKERRSIRAFKPEQITEEELQAVIEAGRFAPTGMNRQPGLIVAVQDPETREKIVKINGEIMGSNGDPFYGAPTILLVLVKADIPTGVCDGSLMLGNMMNAAHALGLGSCWINRIKETFEREDGKALLKEWGIEGEYIGVGSCALGYAACELPAAKERTSQVVVVR